MDALQKQLATLQTIVPEEKQTDQFILMVQNAAVTSGVSIRVLTAKPVATKQYYSEMPFDIQADGPYYAVLDFFARLGRLSRIMNVGDLKLAAMAKTFIIRNPTRRTMPVPYARSRNSINATGPAVRAIESKASAPQANARPSEIN